VPEGVLPLPDPPEGFFLANFQTIAKTMAIMIIQSKNFITPPIYGLGKSLE
jgi:hypothetical protein